MTKKERELQAEIDRLKDHYKALQNNCKNLQEYSDSIVARAELDFEQKQKEVRIVKTIPVTQKWILCKVNS